MSKRLQVVMDEAEFERIRQLADAAGVTVSEWVRGILRREQGKRPSGERGRKLAAVRAAVRHDFPTADIDEMLAEIERGYARG